MSKFLKLFFFLTAFIITLALSSTLAFADTVRTGVITGDGINVRQSPNTSAKVLDQLSKNDQVTILDQSEDWYKISRKDVVGWVYSLYVTVKTASTSTGIIDGDNVNVRETPGTSAKVLIKLDEGTKVTVLYFDDDWYKISYGSTIGWVCGDFIKVSASCASSTKSSVITGSGVNLRSSASTSGSVITQLDKGQKVSVLGSSGEWYKVQTSGGTTGWVHGDFVSVQSTSVSRGDTDDFDDSSSDTDESADDDGDTSSLSSQIVSYAKKYLGVKYVYGGSSPSGFDCSGFTQYVFKHFEISINRTAADQASNGVKVSKSSLKPGDLVLFDTNGGHNHINHAGIYIGSGKFIHASSGKSTHKVTISSLTSGFYPDHYMTARRVIK